MAADDDAIRVSGRQRSAIPAALLITSAMVPSATCMVTHEGDILVGPTPADWFGEGNSMRKEGDDEATGQAQAGMNGDPEQIQMEDPMKKLTHRVANR